MAAYWIPRPFPSSRPPSFGSLHPYGISTVGGIFLPIAAGHGGTVCGNMPLASNYLSLKSSMHPEQTLEIWIRLPYFNGSTVCGAAPLTATTPKALDESLMVWKTMIQKDLGIDKVNIVGIVASTTDTYTPSLSLGGLSIVAKRAGIQFGLLGDLNVLHSEIPASFYLGVAFTTGPYRTGTGAFPFGSDVAFEMCTPDEYCRKCKNQCSFSNFTDIGCIVCRAECVARDPHRFGETAAGGFLDPSPPRSGASTSKELSFDFELLPSIVPADASLPYKYGATIALSRWFQAMPRNNGAGPIMNCGPRFCSISPPDEMACDIAGAYQGFLASLERTQGPQGGKVPVAFYA